MSTWQQPSTGGGRPDEWWNRPAPGQQQPSFGPDGRPIRPEFKSILGPNGGLLQPYQAQGHTAKAFTMSTDMNPWLKLQDQRINQQQAGMRDQLNRDANLGLGTGMSNLAASGGIDSGARERMMIGSAAQRTQGLAGIGQQSAMDRTNTNIQAEMMKKQAQQFNAGALNSNSMFNAGALNNMSQFNAANAIGGVGMQNAFNSNLFNQEMGAWGAAKTADAQAAAAGKGGPKWYENFFTNVQDGSWRPFGAGGSGALGSGDKLGQGFDKYNPMNRWG